MGKRASYLLITKLIILFSIINSILMALFSNGIFALSKESFTSGYIGFILPLMIIINFVFIIIWLIKKKWITSMILIICMFCSYNFIKVRYIHKGLSQKHILKLKNNTDNIKFITYNTANLASQNPDGLLILSKIVGDHNIDIVCFQEFKVPNKLLDSVKYIYSNYPYYFTNTANLLEFKL